MRKLVLYPNKVLKTPTNLVTDISAEQDLIEDMKYISNQENVLGIAANQLGENKSIIICQKEIMINPEILDRNKNFFMVEGCLSFPGLGVRVRRAQHILVKYLTEDGSEITKVFEDLDAVVVQHEIDHLLGLTFLDKISPVKKKLLWKRYKKRLEQE
jgi:peptide deformylase